MSNVVVNNKKVFASEAPPEEVIRAAQLAIVTEHTWHILGQRRAYGERSFCELPEVACPIVDISALPASMDEAVGSVIGEHATPIGYRDVPTLLAELEKLGAQVILDGSFGKGG
jgi:hypothetical protein